MSAGHAQVDKVLEQVKSWFLALTFFDFSVGTLLLLFPKFIGSAFLYTVEPLPAQLFGAALLSLGVMMFIIRDFNRSAYRLLLDYKIILGGLSALAVIVNVLFYDVRWTLIVIALMIIAVTGICVYLRKMIPRETVATEPAHH